MNIFLLNGPPGSGKDTIGELIEELILDSFIHKFAAPLNEIAAACLPEMDHSEFSEWREARKEEPLMTFPTTMRKLLISISEDLIKPIFGRDYFGIRAAHEVLKEVEDDVLVQDMIFTDSGFQNEYDAFIKILSSEPSINVHLIQVHRAGRNFDNDSREWVYSALGRMNYIINNDCSIHELKLRVKRLLLNEIGIQL